MSTDPIQDLTLPYIEIRLHGRERETEWAARSIMHGGIKCRDGGREHIVSNDMKVARTHAPFGLTPIDVVLVIERDGIRGADESCSVRAADDSRRARKDERMIRAGTRVAKQPVAAAAMKLRDRDDVTGREPVICRRYWKSRSSFTVTASLIRLSALPL